ncbi:M16 family metallopeptidase [Parvularcula marina]|nr:pitrilysin family protein [Parvularcula marina]
MSKWMISAGGLALVMALAACASDEGGARSADAAQSSAAAPVLNVSYEKFVLDNGLQVILHQDSSDPVVAINIAAHVGSSRELPGRTGFAHLFEHLLFMDSENLGYGGLDEMNTRIGGTTVNGFTTSDMTQYYQDAPADGLEKIIWAEAEKLGFFIKTVSADVLANEKQVVKNEKRQSYDNQPYGYMYPLFSELLYPEDHPYSWPVIGSLEDLDAAALEDVVAFYKRWYVPNNVTLTIAGDIDPAQAKIWVEKYFGDIPRGEDIAPLPPRAAELEDTVSLYHEDQFARAPRLAMAWPSVEQFHKDAYALDILTTYLAEGKKAPLNMVLIDEEKLTSGVTMYNSTSEIAGELYLIVTAQEGGDLDELMPAIEEGFRRFEENGISEDDLKRIKAGIEVEFYGNLQSVVGKAISLSQYNLFTGNPGFVSTDIERTLAVTADDVMRVYETYLKDRNYVALSFVPQGQLDLVLEGAGKADIKEEVIVEGEGAPVDFDPTARTFEPTPSAFDRSVEPPFGEPYDLPKPEIYKANLKNGIAVYGITTSEVPVVQFSLRIDAGQDRADIEKVGVPALTADLLTRGTANKTVAELEEALQLLGAEINISAGSTATFISGTTLARNFDETVALLEEMLLEPRWDEEEFDLLKRRVAQQFVLAKANPNALAGRVSRELFYGEDHIFHYDSYGTEAQLETITMEDLKDFHAAAYKPGRAALRVVGDVKLVDVKAAFAPLAADWKGEAPETDAPAQPQDVSEAALYFYDVPGAKQSVIRAQRPSLSAVDADYPLAQAINYYLGGTFTSDLNNELRVNKGYTYGARSFFSGTEDRGFYTVSTSVRTNVTLESLELIRDLLASYGESFDEDRLQEMKEALLRQQALQTETLGEKLGVLSEISTYGYPEDYQAQNAARLEAVDLAEFRRLATTYILPGAMNYVVVGDAETQAGRLGDLGFGEPVMVDPVE